MRRSASVSNLWAHGGFFPMGMLGVILALQIVMFAFGGVELIGVTAGEAEDPDEVAAQGHQRRGLADPRLLHRRAARHHVARPLERVRARREPVRDGLRAHRPAGGGGVINFVVITAAASSCNSGIFSTGRMLYTLAHFGQAPRAFGKVNRNHVPALGITVSVIAMLFGVVLNYFIPEQVFVYVTSVALIGTIWTWGMIMLAHIGYRRAVDPRRGGSGFLPDARRPLHQLGRARLPRHGRDLPRLRRRHPGRALRGAGLVRTAGSWIPPRQAARDRRARVTSNGPGWPAWPISH